MQPLQELSSKIQDYEQWIHSLDVRFSNSNLVKRDIANFLMQLDEGEQTWKQKLKEWKEKEMQNIHSVNKSEKEKSTSTNLDKILSLARKIRNQDSTSIRTSELTCPSTYFC